MPNKSKEIINIRTRIVSAESWHNMRQPAGRIIT